MSLTLNTEQWTLEDLLTKVIKKDMGFEEPSLLMGSDCIWEEGDDADTTTFAKNLSKKLKDLPCGGIKHGTMFVIEDFSQDLNLTVTVTHKSVWESEGEEVVYDEDYKFVLSGKKAVPAKAKEEADGKMTNGKTPAAAAQDDDDDDIVVITNRKRSASTDGEPTKKKARVEVPNDDLIVIDDV